MMHLFSTLQMIQMIHYKTHYSTNYKECMLVREKITLNNKLLILYFTNDTFFRDTL